MDPGSGDEDEDEESTRRALARTTQPIAAAPARLVLLTGVDLGRKYPLGKETLLGRATEMDVVLDDPDVSRRHARIQAWAGRFVLEDLGSRNGTGVNGLPLRKRRVLEFGDRIHLGGRVVLLFTHHDPLEQRILQRQKLEAIGRLGAGIAHDFNNLLGAIVSNVEYLEDLPLDTPLAAPDVREGLADVRAASLRAVELTKRLVLFARRKSGSVTSVDLSSLCEDVLALVQRTFSKAITVAADVEGGLTVRGDPAALHQLMMNLCINAHDAMQDGGALTVRLSRRNGDEARKSQASPREYAELEVTDTGVGMDGETRARAFEPFFTTKTRQAGAGLGLATVYDVATSHGGQVEIDSELDEGTVVRVRFPLVPAARSRDDVPTPRRRATSDAAARPEAVILLADDELVVRRSAARLLERAGYRVLSVGDGSQAVQAYLSAEPKPDLVILDLDMPVLGGEAAFERLRDIDPAVPVVFISGHWDAERERLLQRAGAVDMLHKPYEASSLHEAVARALGASVRGPPRAREDESDG